MTIETMRKKIEHYCDEVNNCENCGLSRFDAPNNPNCYIDATDEELTENYNFLVSIREI